MRDALGKDSFVDVAMVDSVLAVCERMIYQHSIFGSDRKTARQWASFYVPIWHVSGAGWICDHRRASPKLL